ncbi:MULTISPECIES: ParB/RepB/Spo0J family partition protein [Limnochorda]|uniref:ParB/RepB/Spo0J family partition protein n=1 Tax=Limnochorda TaxID=1676651 RepID=UPI00181A7DF7|nr:ParB/RepB/Spo0J family partition protein [Limnochorda pilosa]NMA71901.1 ParB/RepB/Spo0J family partition protein [Bacillota bacterium]
MPELEHVPVSLIDPDPGQPRTRFDQEALDGLARSLREVGQLQPILVRRNGDRFRLVAGERRWRAARQLGQKAIAALVLDQGPPAQGGDRLLQLAENLQREDLDPLERARAVAALMEAEGLSQKAVAERLGLPRTTIADWLDLLKVEPRFQEAVVAQARGEAGGLSLSHVNEALALANVRGDEALAGQLLDLALASSLSKAQMRRACRLLRDHPEMEPEEAVRRVLQEARPKTRAEVPEPGTPEANLQRLLVSLDRSASYVEQLSHVSSRFLPPELREALLERFTRLHEVTEKALERLSASPREAAQQAKEERRVRRQVERRRQKERARRLA